ncbi:FAD-dependent oxidoreductase [Candidatus Pacearchaeota archaeon]|nr:FAD-dependent oxidoreductase [Candidatus Pacearchaeota archaeon]
MSPLKFTSEILEIKQLSNSVKHLKISIPKDFNFIPGQYISMILEKENEKIRRPYSLASIPEKANEGYAELCIKILENGLASPIIDKFKANDKINFLGPLGFFKISDESKNKNLIFISHGVGIAPFRSMIPYILEYGHQAKVTLLTGYKEEERILYNDEFKELEKKYKNFKYYSILSEPINNTENNEIGRVQQLVKNNINKEAHYYLCGLKEMVDSVRAILVNNDIEMKNIFSEKYD